MTPDTTASSADMGTLELVKAREAAAAHLQVALAAAGVANAAFVSCTNALGARLNVDDLARRFEVPTILHLQAFRDLLERKLQSTSGPNLREICEHQHFQLREKIALADARENLQRGVL